MYLHKDRMYVHKERVFGEEHGRAKRAETRRGSAGGGRDGDKRVRVARTYPRSEPFRASRPVVSGCLGICTVSRRYRVCLGARVRPGRRGGEGERARGDNGRGRKRNKACPREGASRTKGKKRSEEGRRTRRTRRDRTGRAAEIGGRGAREVVGLAVLCRMLPGSEYLLLRYRG